MDTPSCIGFIMDGNRRYARRESKSIFEGHRLGAEKMKEVISWSHNAGVKTVIFYAFSTENWNREKHEVENLLRLCEEFFRNALDEIVERGVRVRFIGELDRFSDRLRSIFMELEQKSGHATGGTVCIALSYGGRSDITGACNQLLQSGKKVVREQDISEALMTFGLPDPDLIVRTGGDMRLSNFLLWQAAYSELSFTKTLWPDFSLDEFNGILAEYGTRERRRGT